MWRHVEKKKKKKKKEKKKEKKKGKKVVLCNGLSENTKKKHFDRFF